MRRDYLQEETNDALNKADAEIAALKADLADAQSLAIQYGRNIQALADERDDLKARVAELEKREIWVPTTMENEQLRARVAELEDKLADGKEAYAKVMSENCASDERHCACVPHLRQRIAELEAALESIAFDGEESGYAASPITMGRKAREALEASQ